MAASQADPDLKRNGRQPSNRPRGIEKCRSQRSIRTGAHLKEILHQPKEKNYEDTEPEHRFPSPSTSNTPSKKDPQSSRILPKITDSLERLQRSILDPTPAQPERTCYQNGYETNRKRKRLQEAESLRVQDKPTEKRARTSSDSCAAEDKEAVSNTDKKRDHPIDHWLQEGRWPEEYFEPGGQTWEDLGADREADKWAEELRQLEESNRKQAALAYNMAHPPLVRKRSSASIRRQYEELGIETPSDLQREEKSATYRSPGYEKELEKKGSFMYESDLDITEESKIICQNLLSSAQTVVQDSLFRDDRFKMTCQKIHNENEAMVIQDIARLIVPSAKNLATCGATSLKILVESVNRGWNSAISITAPRPQPDYSVAFGQSAFTEDQLEKLKPLIGDLLHQPTDLSYYMATWRMYFPFLTCEVKCGAAALDIADRQNAHSMTHAVRAVVELYKYAKWEAGFDWKKEVHREILAFSISHNDKAVRIYGHYPVIEGDKTTFYRYPVRDFSLTDLDGRDKWTAYKFTKNVYELWMPKHLKRICKAIDAIPIGLDFNVSSASFTSATSAENDPELPNLQETTTSAAASQDTATFKKPRLTANAILQQRHMELMEQLKESQQRLAKEKEESQQRLAKEKEESQQRLAKEKEESQQRLAKEKEESQQRHTELMEVLREDNDRQKQEVNQLKEQNKELMDRLKELMGLLKQRHSPNE